MENYSTQHVFAADKFCGNTATPSDSPAVCAYFHDKTAGVESCNKTEHIYYGTLYKKMLADPLTYKFHFCFVF